MHFAYLIKKNDYGKGEVVFVQGRTAEDLQDLIVACVRGGLKLVK